YSMSGVSLAAVCLIAAILVADAIKLSPQMEKCGEQLLTVLSKESNKEMKATMNKLIKNVQKGELKASQEIINNLKDDQRAYANEHYWVGACGPMRSCLECPVELFLSCFFSRSALTHRPSSSIMAGSDTDSIEIKDALVDATWFSPGEPYSQVPTGLKPLIASQSPENVDEPPFYERWISSAHDRALLARIAKFEHTELKMFIAQKLFKIDSIVCDEQTRLVLIEKMLVEGRGQTTDEQEAELRRKYGRDMSTWLLDRLLPSVSDCGQLIDRATHEYNRLRTMDPLCDWVNDSPDVVSRVIRCVQQTAASMANKVGWSLLREPGTLSCHLSEFIGEFARLEAFFSHNPLTPVEAAQSAFNKNYLTKARSKLLACADSTRVVLRPMRDADGKVSVEDEQFRRSRLIEEIFESDGQVPEVSDGTAVYGTSDFIHASYVRGGPLMNTFICTQAPIESTQTDFWRMIWQERTGMIVMLCAAVETATLGALDRRPLNYCPYYWPKVEGQTLRFGNISVKNLRVDGTADPLFNVTHLEVRRSDDPRSEPLLLQHWQWDWRSYADLHWPFRILRRARLSNSSTVVHCMDGCGRSGALVTIEVALMQFIRGSPQPQEVVFVSSLFTRLQRKHAIMTTTQYLFIYRSLLHWMEPYVTSSYQRFALGVSWFSKTGFVPKYDKYVRDHTKITPAY
ncbi:hypothetical protein PFISCL1PPCAC_14147, partial [Pristionchus fissidentatus]